MKTAGEIKALQIAAGTYIPPKPPKILPQVLDDKQAAKRWAEFVIKDKLNRAERANRAIAFDASDYEDRTPKERLAVLEEFSLVRLEVLSDIELQRRRRAFDSIKNTKFPLYRPGGISVEKISVIYCWVCCENLAEHRHHVILLRNGGAITARRNIVFLCARCYEALHPWVHPINKPVQAIDFEIERNKQNAWNVIKKAAKGGYTNLETAEQEILTCLRNVFNSLAV